jgi:hypothetical protein
LGCVLFLLASPLMGLVTLGLRLSGRGRAIERHRVLGCADTAFNAFKFRSGPNGLTALECWLYVTGLKELPQLPNVLVGQMSLVAPRNIPEAARPHYVAWLIHLRTVKRGLTGHSSQPGLLLEGARQVDIAPPGSNLVGDAVGDVQAAVKVGVQPAMVLTGRGATQVDLLAASGLARVPVC